MELRLREIRTARQLTQRQVAEMAGMSVSYYTEIELGKKQINANRMSSIAKVLGVKPQDLIVDQGNIELVRFLDDLEGLDPAQRKLVYDLVQSLSAGQTPQK